MGMGTGQVWRLDGTTRFVVLAVHHRNGAGVGNDIERCLELNVTRPQIFEFLRKTRSLVCWLTFLRPSIITEIPP